MDKLRPLTYRGIEYVLLQDLPEGHKSIFLTWANDDTIFKIQHNDHLIKDCILFSDYLYWYENILLKDNDAFSEGRINQERKKGTFGFALE